MARLNYPTIVESSKIFITPKRLNYSADDLKILLANHCQEAAETNSIKLLNICFLNNEDTTANSQNVVLKILLPIFPEYYEIEKSIYRFVDRMNMERDFLLRNVNIGQFLNFENGNFEKYNSFFDYPELLVAHLIAPSEETFQKLKTSAFNMRKLTEWHFPSDSTVIENYIKTGSTESESILKMMKTYLINCEGKKPVENPTIKANKDDNQAERLLYYLLEKLSQKYMWANEMLDEKSVAAIKKLKLMDYANKGPIEKRLFESGKQLSSAFEVITNLAEVCDYALQKKFGDE